MKQKIVTFESAGLNLVGNLYSSDGLASGPQAAVVVVHPASGVKEQTAALYARHLAEQGFITLAFDAAYSGESAGEPRGLEDPAHRIEDIKSAVSFMSVRDDVDSERIGLLGICAAGGYVIPATATDHRVKAVAMVSGVSIGEFFRVGYDGKQPPEVLKMMLDSAAKARTAQERSEGTQTFPIFPSDEAAAHTLGQYVYEGWEYYCTPRAYHPRSTKQMPWVSVDKMALFEGFRFIDRVAPRPFASHCRNGSRHQVDDGRGFPQGRRAEGVTLGRRCESRRSLRQRAVRNASDSEAHRVLSKKSAGLSIFPLAATGPVGTVP